MPGMSLHSLFWRARIAFSGVVGLSVHPTFFATTLGAKDVLVIWKYAKVGNIDYYSLVSNTEKPQKTAAFRDYKVDVYSGADLNSLVFRRTDFVTAEDYLYTSSMNIADAGSFQRQLRFVVTVRERQVMSESKTLDVRVVR
jgi:hypothetical protein